MESEAKNILIYSLDTNAGQLRRAFRSLTHSSFKQLYVAFVRSHLEYAVAAWNPYTKKVLEKVQQRATKLLRGIKHLTYEQRLRELNVWTNWLVNPNERNDEGESRTPVPDHQAINKIMQREHFWPNRVANSWRELPTEVVHAKSTISFKNPLDRHLKLKEKNIKT